ncbi:hypothetical protein [Thermoactinomyces sp. DSM 45891]|uniref:hypothetical protein n=1 Tax=Thermoactinomyces sp. DSM 45891 TaxID=1761907 RepID=UPI0011612976|nr:hypothetical protein [Thermoactinomyces sp. DSM 45891]
MITRTTVEKTEYLRAFLSITFTENPVVRLWRTNNPEARRSYSFLLRFFIAMIRAVVIRIHKSLEECCSDATEK